MMGMIIFILVTVTLFILPLLPAFIELLRPTDTHPLKIVQAYDTNVKHFAVGFKRYLEEELGKDFEQTLHLPRKIENSSHNRASFRVIQHGEETTLPGLVNESVILSADTLTFPEGYTFEREIYGTNTITIGKNSTVRAILCEDQLHVKKGGVLLRWAHATHSLHIAQNCLLLGRVSSDSDIHLSADTEFTRLFAPRILIETHGHTPVMQWDLQQLTPLKKQNDLAFESPHRWVYKEDAIIPENTCFEGNIIASRHVHIGHGSYIRGSIKANGNLILGNKVMIEGSAVSQQDITTGQHCHITGPVIAENKIFIGSQNIIGIDIRPTSLTAPIISISHHVLVHGSIWALEKAMIISKQDDELSDISSGVAA